MKAFIFDFDGVLVDSQSHWDLHVYDFYLHSFPALSREECDAFKGYSGKDVYRMLSEKYESPRTEQEHWSHANTFAEEIYGRVAPVDGVLPLLDRLSHRGTPLAIASAGQKAWIEAVLRRLGLHHHFQTVVSADDVERSKPFPDPYLKAAQMLGIDTSQCVALEDSHHGMTSANAAGMTCIGYIAPHEDPTAYPEAHHHVTSLHQIDDEFLSTLKA